MRHRDFERCGIPVTEVEILDDNAARRLGKPIGHYLTLTLGELPGRTGDTFERTVQAVTETLMGLLPKGDTLPALVIGLGNRNITPDAVGPIAIDHTLATRHLITQAPEYFGQWRPVAAVHTGVEDHPDRRHRYHPWFRRGQRSGGAESGDLGDSRHRHGGAHGGGCRDAGGGADRSGTDGTGGVGTDDGHAPGGGHLGGGYWPGDRVRHQSGFAGGAGAGGPRIASILSLQTVYKAVMILP